MKIEKLTDNKIRIIINIEELSEQNIDIFKTLGALRIKTKRRLLSTSLRRLTIWQIFCADVLNLTHTAFTLQFLT